MRITRRDGFERVLCMHRWLEGVGADVLVAANLQEMPWNGFDASAAIDLPANGFVVFARSAH